MEQQTELDYNYDSWTELAKPSRILAIRLHAMGDILITLPYLAGLKAQLGDDMELDFLCMSPVAEIAKKTGVFNRVYHGGTKPNSSSHLRGVLPHIPALILRSYDAVIDLQNNRLSRFVRRCLAQMPYSEFDRFSSLPAGERVEQTINRLGVGQCYLNHNIAIGEKEQTENLLSDRGWSRERQTVLLNPAGFFETRHWPIENYVEFAKLWLERIDPSAQFLVTGTDRLVQKANYLIKHVPGTVIDTVNCSTLLDAYIMVQLSDLVISEDGALMHAAWTNGVPLVALLGSSRDDWCRPLSKNSAYFSSSDLPCGNCMLAECELGTNLCMTRVQPEDVFNRARLVLCHDIP